MATITYILSVTGDCSSTNAGAITLSNFTGGTSPYTVQWYSPSLGTDASVTVSTRTSLSAGTYTIKLIDSSAPTPTEDVFNFTVSSSGVCCNISAIQSTQCGQNNGYVNVSSSGGYSPTIFYLHNSGGTIINSAITTINFFSFGNLTASTYYITALEYGGCTGRSETFVIDNSSELDFDFYTVPNVSCSYIPNGKVYVTGVTGTPPFSYTWFDGSNESYVTGLTSGSYGVTVTDAYGCSKIKSVTLEEVGPVSVQQITAIPPSCLSNNGSITLLLTGGTPPYYYSASTGYVELSYNNNLTFDNLGAGPYSFSITDAGLCKTSCSTTLNTPSGMTSISVVVKDSSCSSIDGSIFVSLQGGNNPYTYKLQYPSGEIKQTQSVLQNNLFSTLSAGTYYLQVNDSSGCTYSNYYTIETETLFSVWSESTPAKYGNSNGTITAYKSSGGTSPFDYSLDGSKFILKTNLSAVTFTDVRTGSHQIIVTDSNGCKELTNIFVDEIPAVNFMLYPTTAGDNSGGTITALISSGTPPFTINWSDNVRYNPQTIKVENLTGGTYSLTLTDANGSTQTRTTVVPSRQKIVSYETFEVGNQPFVLDSTSKYSLSKMLGEGYVDITSGFTSCELVSASFTAKVEVDPLGIVSTDTFYTTTSLLNPPNDNIWYTSIKNLLLSTIGVADVTIDELTNEIKITSDRNQIALINGQETIINLKVYLLIDYDINCM